MEIARRSTASEKPRVALGSTSSSRCQTSRAPAESQARGFVFFANEIMHRIKRAAPSGGAIRDRTDDLLLAKQALPQLSYGPSPVDYWYQDCWLAELQLAASRTARLRHASAAFASLPRAKAGGPGKI